MTFSTGDLIALASLLFLVLGGAYKFSKIETDLNNKINAAKSDIITELFKISAVNAEETKQLNNKIVAYKSELLDRISDIQLNFTAHLSDYNVRKDWHTETARGLKQMIAHKFSRLNYHILDIQRHLEKQSGFVIRAQPVADPDDEQDT